MRASNDFKHTRSLKQAIHEQVELGAKLNEIT